MCHHYLVALATEMCASHRTLYLEHFKGHPIIVIKPFTILIHHQECSYYPIMVFG